MPLVLIFHPLCAIPLLTALVGSFAAVSISPPSPLHGLPSSRRRRTKGAGRGRAGELRPGHGDSARENRASPRPASARQERWGGAARRHPGHRTPPCQAPTAARRGGREGAGGPARRGRPRSTPPPAAALRLPLPWPPPPAGLPVVVAQVHEGPDVSLRATARSPCRYALRATALSPRRRLASSSCPPR